MRHNRGFTLIEILGATAAFVIAFLAGTAAFTKLLHHQMANYHRTLAGVVAWKWAQGPLDTAGAQTVANQLARNVNAAGAFVSPRIICVNDGGALKLYYQSAVEGEGVFLGRYTR